jgi:DNA invertase Pin-like site-specific DNA recombinase
VKQQTCTSVYDGGIDTTTAAGRMVFGIFATLAEFERELIRERTMAGLAAAKARGRKGGRRPKLTPETITYARALLADPKVSITDLARTFGVDRATLYRALAVDSATRNCDGGSRGFLEA